MIPGTRKLTCKLLPTETVKEVPQLHQNDFSRTVNNICNLPLEMKRKIVSYLSYDDYANLRMACQRFSQEFASIENLSLALRQGECKGSYKQELTMLQLEQRIGRMLKGEQNRDVCLALQHTDAYYAAGASGDIIIATEYLPNAYGTKETYRISQAIELSQKALPPGVFCASSSSFILHLYPKKPWSNLLLFRDDMMDTAAIKKVFATFQQTYNDITGHEKLVVAGFAAGLKNAWLRQPPAGVSRAEMSAIVAQYEDLFRTGETAKKMAQNMQPHAFWEQNESRPDSPYANAVEQPEPHPGKAR